MVVVVEQTCLFSKTFLLLLVACCLFTTIVECKSKKNENADEKWKKKHVTDYSDADLERLYEQWEEADDEPLPDDELPEWKRPQPKIDMSKLDPNDPEGMLKMTKKGKTVMLFATVTGNPTEKETETTSMLWQSSLHNANVEVQRYVVGSNRVLFVVRDGTLAWAAKDFLVTQDNCEVVTIEGKDYFNEKKNQAGATKKPDEKKDKKAKKEQKEEDKRKKKKEEKLRKLEEKKIKQNIENEIHENLKNKKTEL